LIDGIEMKISLLTDRTIYTKLEEFRS